MKMVSEGAEALIYSTTLYGKEVLIKYRAPKRYRIKELDENIRKSRTKKEAKLMVRAAETGVNVPGIIGVGANEIYLEKINGKLLKDIKMSAQLSKKAGEQLGRLHNAGITHGDFTPANLISSDNEIYIIDFGLAGSTSSSEERALDMLLMKRQISPELYSDFVRAYSRTAKSSKETMSRLDEVEERGRYQVRTLS